MSSRDSTPSPRQLHSKAASGTGRVPNGGSRNRAVVASSRPPELPPAVPCRRCGGAVLRVIDASGDEVFVECSQRPGSGMRIELSLGTWYGTRVLPSPSSEACLAYPIHPQRCNGGLAAPTRSILTERTRLPSVGLLQGARTVAPPPETGPRRSPPRCPREFGGPRQLTFFFFVGGMPQAQLSMCVAG